MTTSQLASYRYCQQLARRTGRNFYFSFLTLPRPMFRDMCVLYAFMRRTDDLADREDIPVDERRRRLTDWRMQLDAALEGRCDGDRILPALADMVQRREVPPQYLHEVVSGVESDLTPRRFQTFAELERYCYQVAGAVGLCCIHIWGFRDARAEACAVDCGLAFQLTNILRDLGADAAVGRLYLPVEELRRFGCCESRLRSGVVDDRLRELMAFQVERARVYYRRAGELYEYLPRPGRCILSAMLGIYAGLLREIERRGYDVFTERVRLSTSRKLAIAASSLCGRRFQLPVRSGRASASW